MLMEDTLTLPFGKYGLNKRDWKIMILSMSLVGHWVVNGHTSYPNLFRGLIWFRILLKEWNCWAKRCEYFNSLDTYWLPARKLRSFKSLTTLYDKAHCLTYGSTVILLNITLDIALTCIFYFYIASFPNCRNTLILLEERNIWLSLPCSCDYNNAYHSLNVQLSPGNETRVPLILLSASHWSLKPTLCRCSYLLSEMT